MLLASCLSNALPKRYGLNGAWHAFHGRKDYCFLVSSIDWYHFRTDLCVFGGFAHLFGSTTGWQDVVNLLHQLSHGLLEGHHDLQIDDQA